MQHIEGHCPACGRNSLFAAAGQITCAYKACPEQGAAHRILSDSETLHITRIHRDETFTVRHPLIERLDDRMMECQLVSVLQHVLHYSPTQPEPGDYRVALVHDGTVHWERK